MLGRLMLCRQSLLLNLPVCGVACFACLHVLEVLKNLGGYKNPANKLLYFCYKNTTEMLSVSLSTQAAAPVALASRPPPARPSLLQDVAANGSERIHHGA